MTTGPSVLTRTMALGGYLVFFAVIVLGCSKRPTPGQATGGVTSGASGAGLRGGPPGAQIVCSSRGTSFSLGPVDGLRATEGGEDGAGSPNGAPGEPEGDGDATADLPYGVTVGSAAWHASGYVISAIDARQGGSHAVLAFVDPEVARGSVLDLGRVYGDAEPPRAVLLDNRAFVVVPDTDAGGNSYRYGWVRGLDGRSKVEWLGSFEQQVDDSAVFALSSTEVSITIAWDEVERTSHLSRVRWASLDASGRRISSDKGPQPLTSKPSTKSRHEPDWLVNSTGSNTDAEAPQLVAHRGGYWLAYLAADPTQPKKSSADGAARPRTKSAASDDDTRVIELGRRGLEVLPLDANGRPNGKAIRVADRTAHVVAFDIEVTPDDGAVVAYRDADATPGVEAQIIELARIRPDGGVTRQRIDDERVGAGTPVLLVDPEPSAGRTNPFGAWIAVSGSVGETRLGRLGEPGQTSVELLDAPQLVGVEPMLWRGDAMLVVRHRARFVEFERLTCTLGAEAPAAKMR